MVFMYSNILETNQRPSLFPATEHMNRSQYVAFRYFMDLLLPGQCEQTAADSHLPVSLKSWLKYSVIAD